MTTRSLAGLTFALALILSACGPSAPAASAPSQVAAAPPGQTATASGIAAPNPASATPVPSRRATLSELLNEVLARASQATGLTPAAEGEVLGPGGQVRTGEDSKARIDLTEGTIVRLAPMSEFTVSELNPDAANPFTHLSLALGKLWVILSGGSLEVETPMGVATVRGSYLGVDFYPEYKVLVVTCLEGNCELKNDLGTTLLASGQAASINGEGQPPSSVRPMTDTEIQQWTDENPEAVPVAPTRAPVVDVTAEAATKGTPLPPSGSGFPRTQPLSYDIRNVCTTEGIGHATFIGTVTVQVDVPPGEQRSGQLPPSLYALIVALDSGATFGPFPADSDAGPVIFSICGDNASTPGGGSPPPPVNTNPNHYTLVNPCVNDLGTWHVKFVGPTTVQVDIPPGETRSGDLPNGDYTVTEWEDNTPFSASGHMSPGDSLTIPHACGAPLGSTPPPP